MSHVFGHRTLIKTQDYLDVFARFKQKENIEAVERMLTSKTELELFERSQLGQSIHSPAFLPLTFFAILVFPTYALNTQAHLRSSSHLQFSESKFCLLCATNRSRANLGSQEAYAVNRPKKPKR